MAHTSAFDPDNAFDIVFSFDTTGSMTRALDEVKGRIGDMIQRLKADIPFIRIAIITHGDYCDKDVYYLEHHKDFTSDMLTLQQFLQNVEGTGGGDPEECYEYILHLVRGLSWAHGSQRALVMIGDSVPHEPDYELNTDNFDWRVETKALAEMGVKIYGVQAFDEEESAKFFQEMAGLTSGQHLKLSEFSNICDIIMAICYREKGAEYLEGYEAEVRAREAATGLHKDLEGIFGALRRDDSNVSKAGSVKSLSAAGSITPMPSFMDFDLISPLSSPCTSKVTITAKKVKSVHSKNIFRQIKKKATKHLHTGHEKKSKTERSTSKHTSQETEYRHMVPRTKLVLEKRNVVDRWNNWKMLMCSDNNQKDNSFVPRKKKLGFRRRCLFPRDDVGRPALYEVAVQKDKRLKRYVMYSKVCTINKNTDWERRLFGNNFVRRQVDHVLRNKGYIWIRRFTFKRIGKQQKQLVDNYRFGRLYKYAWNSKTKLINPGTLSWAMETD